MILRACFAVVVGLAFVVLASQARADAAEPPYPHDADCKIGDDYPQEECGRCYYTDCDEKFGDSELERECKSDDWEIWCAVDEDDDVSCRMVLSRKQDLAAQFGFVAVLICFGLFIFRRSRR